jgi:hypothetical protein
MSAPSIHEFHALIHPADLTIAAGEPTFGYFPPLAPSTRLGNDDGPNNKKIGVAG